MAADLWHKKVACCGDVEENLVEIVTVFMHKKSKELLLEKTAGPLLCNTVKALLSPRGAYLILDLPEGGLIERGAY